MCISHFSSTLTENFLKSHTFLPNNFINWYFVLLFWTDNYVVRVHYLWNEKKLSNLRFWLLKFNAFLQWNRVVMCSIKSWEASSRSVDFVQTKKQVTVINRGKAKHWIFKNLCLHTEWSWSWLLGKYFIPSRRNRNDNNESVLHRQQYDLSRLCLGTGISNVGLQKRTRTLHQCEWTKHELHCN